MHDAALRALPAVAVVREREIGILCAEMSPSEQTRDSTTGTEVGQEERRRRTLLNTSRKIALADYRCNLKDHNGRVDTATRVARLSSSHYDARVQLSRLL